MIMKHKAVEHRVDMIIRDLNKKGKGRWNLDYANQRPEGQWKRTNESLLIHTILQGHIIPEIFITWTAAGKIPPKTVIDGRQRLSIIYNYYNNTFSLSDKTPDVELKEPQVDEYGNKLQDENGNILYKKRVFVIKGKKFSQLEEELQEIFLDYEFSVRQIYDATEDEVIEQMFRLNNGKALTPAQKAMTNISCSLAEEINKIADNDFFIKRVRTNNNNSDSVAAVLNSLKLLIGDEIQSLSGSNSNNLETFANEYNSCWTKTQLDDLNKSFTFLDNILPDDIPKRDLKSNNGIPILMMNLDTYYSMLEDDIITEDKYKSFLELWYKKGVNSFYYTGVDKSGKNGSKKTTIKQRIDIIDKALHDFVETGDFSFDVEDEENVSETEPVANDLNDDSTTVDSDISDNQISLPFDEELTSHGIFDFVNVDKEEFITKSRIVATKDFKCSSPDEVACSSYEQFYQDLDEYSKQEIDNRVEYAYNMLVESALNDNDLMDKFDSDSILCVIEVMLSQYDRGDTSEFIAKWLAYIGESEDVKLKLEELDPSKSSYMIGRVSYLNNIYQKLLNNE